tara:strand:+ start:6075 stop:7829 length:1755 start_codon:yes stop_codon:yes gene_type:complete
MNIIVKKFGGSSLGDIEKIKRVANLIIQSKEDGNDVVVVVSAMGKSTDELNVLANTLSHNPNKRELDMLLSSGEQISMALLAIALNEMGFPAISFTGSQVGIITESSHGKARILEIKTDRIQSLLSQDYVVVIAGFQGMTLGDNRSIEITTLGRGGSDTSAVALASSLNAERCEIYTDVPGVLTTDPRIVPEAKLLESITCEEMLELASLGANVLHPRAVEIARNYGVKLYVKSSFNNNTGTILTSQKSTRDTNQDGLELSKPVNSLEILDNQVILSLSHVPDKPGIAANLFETLSKANISVDLIIQATHEGNNNDISFTVNNEDFANAKNQCEELIKHIGGELTWSSSMAKISIQGAGIMGRPSISANLFETLSQANINVRLIATSEIKVSCVIDTKNRDKASRAITDTFNLQKQQININEFRKNIDYPEVRGIALDTNQSQVSIKNIPDKPGVAASICLALSEANIIFDTIVQSERFSTEGTKDISFTLNKLDIVDAEKALKELTKDWSGSSIEYGKSIARVSAVGAGMATTAGTAGKIFRALANEKINIDMIATSEIRTSCIVSKEDGNNAVRAIHEFFNL